MNDTTPSPEVVRTTRAYLVAMLPPGDVPDAWHDVLDDVRYWGDTAMRPVLTVAHSVVQQRQPATEEARLLALLEDARVVDDGDLAAIMGLSEERIDELRAAVREFAHDAEEAVADDGEEARDTVPAPADDPVAAVPAPVAQTPTTVATTGPVAEVGHAARRFETPRDAPGVGSPAAPVTPADLAAQRVRIGFDDDAPAREARPVEVEDGPWPGVDTTPRTRVLLAWAFGIWIVVAVLAAVIR